TVEAVVAVAVASASGRRADGGVLACAAAAHCQLPSTGTHCQAPPASASAGAAQAASVMNRPAGSAPAGRSDGSWRNTGRGSADWGNVEARFVTDGSGLCLLGQCETVLLSVTALARIEQR